MRIGTIIPAAYFLLPLTLTAQSKYETAPEIEYEMIYVEGGEFLMGDLFFEHNPDALPVHRVRLDDFYIGRYPVTFAQYDEFARLNNYPLPAEWQRQRGDRAVVDVSWNEALAFCESIGYRLPKETEWEYAARSGGKVEMFSGTNIRDSLHYYAHFRYNSPPVSRTVGTKKPNGLGIYDMSGNVYEWIGDWYMQYQGDPIRRVYYPTDEKDLRVIRGGSSFQLPFTIRTYWRVYTFRHNRSREIGFRCAQ